ncbi:hypothetical protein L3Y34_013070 [Caenorhabditis briggsae]|uniref:Uncharacterized protein n=1 Tax=Caenorhabditis briggsae TaxID=6238 RepID=A0AAE9CWM3_CAEBR|nr:hypothetical protein L3Y34_013070 [Caenorhabditis briggsae]
MQEEKTSRYLISCVTTIPIWNQRNARKGC